jgi:hypothetical protein|tara:strand:- start:28990 stop:29292 length:303 start_codon:yes stop_codon:yes gene_type:complete
MKVWGRGLFGRGSVERDNGRVAETGAFAEGRWCWQNVSTGVSDVESGYILAASDMDRELKKAMSTRTKNDGLRILRRCYTSALPVLGTDQLLGNVQDDMK